MILSWHDSVLCAGTKSLTEWLGLQGRRYTADALKNRAHKHIRTLLQPEVCAPVTADLNFNLLNIELEVKAEGMMKTVTMLHFRRNAAGILRRIAKGERFVLSHRGRPAARLEPLLGAVPSDLENDPFLTIGRRATPSPKGKTRHQDIDRIV